MKKDELLDFTMAAAVLEISRAGVSVAVKRGLIKTEQHGPVRLIRKKEVLRYQKEKKKPGRPLNSPLTA